MAIPSKSVRIVQQKAKTGLSKAQKLFNQLTNKIEKKRQALELWRTAIPVYQKARIEKLEPLQESFDTLRAELVKMLDQAYTTKGFTKNEKAKIQHLICKVASELLATNEDETLKKIYNKYNEVDFDTEREVEQDFVKTMLEKELGIEIDEALNWNSQEDVLHHLKAKLEHQEAEQAARESAKPQHGRKKSAKTLEKEAKLQEEQAQASQSIREVYRKLASALHPDKELDAIERDRKIALMQRVNVAYDKRDLLQLLKLQLEVEQIDQAAIDTLSEDRLKHFNRILTEQHQELENEIFAIESSFKLQFNLQEPGKIPPQFLLLSLEEEVENYQDGIHSLKEDLTSFQTPKGLKNWLKLYDPNPHPFFNVEDLFSFEDHLFKDFEDTPPKQARASRASKR